jgi:GntR family transcriptional regulator/MocR family aminotransferase
LREAIAAHVNATRGLRCTAEEVIVTNGAQQAAALLFRTLLDPGDAAWIEEPGLLDVRGALIEAGAKLVPVPVDTSGVDVAAGRRAAPKARLAYISPSHQYPTGATLSHARRLELLQWAERANAWIVEDDYDSYFRYEGHPVAPLQRLDAERNGSASRVAYIGTFSKTMYPSLRLGYCIVPAPLVPLIANARAIADRNSPVVEQAALTEFMREGFYDRHLRRVRTVCAERYAAMRHALESRLSDVLTVQRMHAGTHVVVTLRPAFARSMRAGLATGVSPASAIAAAATADGLVVFPMDRYCLQPPVAQQLVLGYGGIPEARIRAGVERLAAILL